MHEFPTGSATRSSICSAIIGLFARLANFAGAVSVGTFNLGAVSLRLSVRSRLKPVRNGQPTTGNIIATKQVWVIAAPCERTQINPDCEQYPGSSMPASAPTTAVEIGRMGQGRSDGGSRTRVLAARAAYGDCQIDWLRVQDGVHGGTKGRGHGAWQKERDSQYMIWRMPANSIGTRTP